MNSSERLFTFKVSLIMGVRMLGLFMIFPVMSVYATDYDNSSPFLIGVAIGIYGLTQALFQIPFGYFSDRYGRKPLLILGLCIFFIGSILSANSTDIIFVVIGRALQGGGAISAVLMAFLADSVSAQSRVKANAFVGFQIGLAFMISLIIGPIITSSAGLSGLFWVIGLLSIVAIFIVVTLPSAKPIKYYNLSIATFREVLNPKLLRLDFSIFSLHMILSSSFIVMPLLIVENNIVTMVDNWQLYIPAMLFSFIGMLPLIILSEKYKKTKSILLFCIAILILSQGMFFTLNLNFSVFLLILTIFFVAFNSIEAILPSLLSKIASTSKRGLAMGIFSTSQFLGTFFGGAIGGLIYNIYDLNSVFLLSIFVAIIWWFSIITLPQKLEALQE